MSDKDILNTASLSECHWPTGRHGDRENINTHPWYLELCLVCTVWRYQNMGLRLGIAQDLGICVVVPQSPAIAVYIIKTVTLIT